MVTPKRLRNLALRLVDDGLIVHGKKNSRAWFSDDEKYRYALIRRWNDFDELKSPFCVWVLLNPSTADEKTNDATVRRCISFSKAMDCSGMVMLNLFAWRSRTPLALKKVKDPIGPLNNEVLRALGTGSVLCGWGTHGAFAEREQEVRKLISGRCWCLGVTKNGSPRHPLYLPTNSKKVEWKGEL